jgi:hypothetical protein
MILEEQWQTEFENNQSIHPDHPLDEKSFYIRDKMKKHGNGLYSWSDTSREWRIYLEACKNRQAEIEKLQQQNKKYREVLKLVAKSPNYLTTFDWSDLQTKSREALRECENENN